MDFNQQLLFFFSALGVFNGFIVSIYFLFFTKKKKLSNYFLGILILMLCLRIGKSLLIIFVNDYPVIIHQIGLSSCFLIGPALYFYLKSSLKPVQKIPVEWKVHWTALVVIILVVSFLYPYETHREIWNGLVKVIYASWIVYILISGYLLSGLFLKVVHKNLNLSSIEIWLLCVFIGNAVICASYVYGYFGWYTIGPLSFSFVFYALLVFLLFKRNRDIIFKEITPKYATKRIDSKEATKLIDKLDLLMENQKLFKNNNIKLKEVSSGLGISTHQLSQLLNDNLKKSFTHYINELRIEEAKKLILKRDQYTLEAIGEEAGFSSKSSFYAIFKKMTGLTPSQYRKTQ